jgi:hypothetical protein
MESFTHLGNMYAQSTLHKVAYSALPDAPVQPYIEPRRRLRRLMGSIRHPIGGRAHTPAMALRTAPTVEPC